MNCIPRECARPSACRSCTTRRTTRCFAWRSRSSLSKNAIMACPPGLHFAHPFSDWLGSGSRQRTPASSRFRPTAAKRPGFVETARGDQTSAAFLESQAPRVCSPTSRMTIRPPPRARASSCPTAARPIRIFCASSAAGVWPNCSRADRMSSPRMNPTLSTSPMRCPAKRRTTDCGMRQLWRSPSERRRANPPRWSNRRAPSRLSATLTRSLRNCRRGPTCDRRSGSKVAHRVSTRQVKTRPWRRAGSRRVPPPIAWGVRSAPRSSRRLRAASAVSFVHWDRPSRTNTARFLGPR